MQIKKIFFFIQIGAGDGVAGDSIYEELLEYEHWSGIMVEPVPHLHEKSKQNFKNINDITYINSAISESGGPMTFYSCTPICPHSGLSGFSKDHILKHARARPDKFSCIETDFSDHFNEVLIPTITFRDLLKENNVSHIDLLIIDAEGYDFKILKTIDFNIVTPSIIMYEHIHINDASTQIFLKGQGYKVPYTRERFNTIAVHESLNL